MPSKFLTAKWQYLLMANYAIDPKELHPYLPYGTELDLWNGLAYVSLVGFIFKDTKVLGIPIPFHRHFEEVNLRFYVRYRSEDGWRRGVVFVKEIVPKLAISFVANNVYGEHYHTLPMKHHIDHDLDHLNVEYYWKFQSEWNYIKATANPDMMPLKEGSEAEFITEHYWGYTQLSDKKTSQYQVEHPRWEVFEVNSCEVNCNATLLYGPAFGEAMQAAPVSTLLAKGSEIIVRKGEMIR